LRGVDLSGVDITDGHHGYVYLDITGARYDARTRWPAGFDPTKDGADCPAGFDHEEDQASWPAVFYPKGEVTWPTN
jgi:hypothetical protein